MKNILKLTLILVLVSAAVFSLSACGNDEPEYTGFYSDTETTDPTTVPTTSETKPELKDDEIVSYVNMLVEEVRSELKVKIYCGNSFVYVNAAEANAPVDMSLVELKLAVLGYDAEEIMAKYDAIVGAVETEELEDHSPINREVVEMAVEKLYDDCKRRASSEYTVEENKLTIVVGEMQYCVKKNATVSDVVKALEAGDYSDIEARYNLRNPDMHWKDILAQVTVEGNNAYYEYVSKTENAKLVPEVKGYILTQATVQPVYENAKPGDVLEFTAEPWDPEITTENIEEKMFYHTIASKSSWYNYNLIGRTSNIKLAADFIDGSVIMPGQYFSFNGTVGERTAERGFKDATIYSNGTMEEGLGGGICQVSSTIYAAAMRAGLLEGNRANHAFTVDYVALGEDATVHWDSGLDYRFKNTLDAPIMIRCVANGGQLEVSILGTEESDVFSVTIQHEEEEKLEQEMKFKEDPSLKPGEKKVDTKGKPGYKIKTTIYIYKNGEYYSSKKYTDIYDPYPGLTYMNKHDLTSSETSETTTETTTGSETTATTPEETTASTPPETTEPPVTTTESSATTTTTAASSAETEAGGGEESSENAA